MEEKIAVLIDSGSDVLKESQKNLFVLPLLIHLDNKTYVDGVNISLGKVLALSDSHKINSSLPSTIAIIKTLDEIKDLGYTHVIFHTISSRLSGTYNIIRSLTKDYEGLKISVFDTKNISKASGYSAITTLELIDQGYSFNQIIEKLQDEIEENKLFFTIGNLAYLQKGGHISLFTSKIGNLLQIKPIISCNEDGLYYTIKKIRGFQTVINKMIPLVQDFIADSEAYDLTLLVTEIDETIKTAIQTFKTVFVDVANFEVKQITPALAIYTGPQAFGVAIRRKTSTT